MVNIEYELNPNFKGDVFRLCSDLKGVFKKIQRSTIDFMFIPLRRERVVVIEFVALENSGQ